MKTSRRIAASLVLLVIAAAGVALAGARSRFTVTVEPIVLQKEERVYGFHVVVKKGAIVRLPHVPGSYRLKLTNSDDNEATLDASAMSGMGALRPDWFREFLDVELIDGGTVRVKIETTTDFERTARVLSFDPDKVTLTPREP